MNGISYLPRHRATYAGDAEMQRDEPETLNRLLAYSRRSKRGVVVRLDERRALREALRPVRTDHFGGDVA